MRGFINTKDQLYHLRIGMKGKIAISSQMVGALRTSVFVLDFKRFVNRKGMKKALEKAYKMKFEEKRRKEKHAKVVAERKLKEKNAKIGRARKERAAKKERT